jgi:uncharacterized protein (DUF697 family)
MKVSTLQSVCLHALPLLRSRVESFESFLQPVGILMQNFSSLLRGVTTSKFALAACLLAVMTSASAQSSSTNVVSGAISVPGEQDVFVFNVATNSLFYFDALTNVNTLHWTLSGPSATLVSDRSFTASDGQSIADPILTLPPGDYTLTIDCNGDATDSYAFRFVNLVGATLLTPGSVVSGSLSPANETDFYQFNAGAGDRFFFDQISRVNLPNSYWRLVDPYGNTVFNQGFTDIGSVGSPTTLPADGTYTLLIEGYIGEPGSGTYSFNVSPQGHVAIPPFTGTPLTLGSIVASNLVANTTNYYLFTLSNPARLVFDNQTNSPNLNWTLEGPSGIAVNQRNLNSSDGQTYSGGYPEFPAGNYQLRIRGTANNSYRFRLLDVTSGVVIAPGTNVSGALIPGRELDVYRFSASAGSRLFFASLSQSNMPNCYWRLIDPYGGVVFWGSFNTDQGPIGMSATGIYTLVIDSYYLESGDGAYTFNIRPVVDGSQALTLGTIVNGSISSPAQRQNYSFTLGSATRLYFDSLTNVTTLRWSLSGPSGTLVNSRAFTGSDSQNNNSPLISAPAGDYMLTVFGTADNTGDYRFRLFDVSTATPMTPGTPVSSTLNPANETDAYSFTLGSPGKYFFDTQSPVGLPNAYERLFDSHGNLFVNTGLGNDVGPLTLPAGSYLVLIEGYYADPGNGSYTFNVRPVADGSQALTLGSIVTGSVATPGQFQQYTFTLGSAARLYFDSQTNNGNMRWSLTGPTGTLVNNRAFTGSDAQNNNSPLISAPAGDYTLTVFGTADNTGDYRFRLFDVSTATPMTPGTPVSSTLNPANETDAYSFTLGSPGKYFFDTQDPVGLPNAYERLFDSHGNLFINAGLGTDVGPLNLPAGSYLVLIEGYYGDTGSGSYTFNVRPVVDGIQGLTLGSIVTGSVATPGQFQQYTFTLGSAARLYFDSQTNNGNLRWTLTGPTGTLVNNRAFTSSDGQNNSSPLISASAGDYTLTVFGTADSTGDYRFRLFDVSTATPMTPGTPVSSTLNPANETDAYSFTLGSPGKYFFDTQNPVGSPNAYERLFDSHGSLFINTPLGNDVGPMTLGAGSYLILIEGYHSDPGSGSYTFNLTPVIDGSQALVLGTPVTGSITTPGQVQQYTFTLGSAARLYFDSLTNTSSLRWSLNGPTGNIVNNRNFNSSDWSVGNPVLALPAGNYTITVSAPGDTLGGYQFVLQDFAAATVLTPDTPVNVNNFPANRTDLYRFTVAAGDRFFFDFQSRSAALANTYWRLVDPYDNIIFSRPFSSDAGTNILGVAGTYTLLIEGYIGDGGQGSYAFNVRPEGNVPPTPFTGTPLAIGTVVGGTLATSSTTNAYTFTLGSAAHLYFDALTNIGFNWTLRGPAGVIVNNRDFLSSDGPDFTNPLLVVAAGDYQLTITGAAGGYQFRLLDFASATVLTMGTPVTNTLTTGRSTVFYQFSGTAGDKYYFDGRPSSGFVYQPYVRLYSPLNSIVMDQYVNADVDVFILPQTGTYTLTVEGRIYENAASGTYVFNLQPVTYPTNALTIGAVVGGSIATVGQRNYYTFTLGSPARLYFDVLTNADFQWRLDAPWGQIVDWRAFQYSDSYDYSNPLLALEAGNYTLAIQTPGGAATGDYQFRLLNLTSATSFTPGTLVSSALTPARSTVFYQFNAAAGDKFFFDGRPSSGFAAQPWVRIYSPLNNIVMEQYVNSDVDTFSVPQSGTYVLTVEGRYNDNNASGTFSFNLQPVTYPTNALTIGAVTSGSLSTVGQRQYYTFALGSPARLYFDTLTNIEFHWRLDAPWGQVVDWRSSQASDSSDIGNPLLALEAGSYTLAVEMPSGGLTGDYQFRLLNFASALALTPGTPVTNTLAPARSTVFYQFNGNAGDNFYFDGRPSSGFGSQPYVRIYSPLNNIVIGQNANSDVDTFSLPQSGLYVLTVEGHYNDNSASGTYAFNLQPVTHLTNGLTIGTIAAGSISTLGQRHFYTLTLASAARLYFDVLTSVDFQWRLDAPWGEVVDWRSFHGSDSSDIGNPLLALEAGNYTLTLQTPGAASTGDYQFRLLDFTSATAFTPGTPVNNTLAPARSTVFYRFNASAGDRFYYDGRPSSGFGNQPYVRLYSPLNSIVMGQNANADVETFSVPQSGLYVLTVEGHYYDNSPSGNYAFNLVPNPPQPQQPLFATNNSPDLIVSAVSVSPPSGLQSGDSATVQWTVQNAGNAATAGSFTDRVTIRNTATSLIIVNNTLLYNESDPGNGPIAPGGTRARQLSFTLPDGTNSVGNLEVTVTTDTLNNILELNSGGSGEANNASSTNITTTLAPYPDLLVHSVTATPPTRWLPGSTVSIQWRLTNGGPRAATNDWVDSIVIRNTNTAYAFNATTNYIISAPGNGAIAPGGFRDRTLNFTVPNDANAYGGFEITVTVDSASQVFEFNGAGTAEANNSRALITSSAPDLRVTGLGAVGNPSLRSSANLTINWNIANDGNVDTGAGFWDRVFVRNNSTATVLLDTTTLYNPAGAGNGPIPPGGSHARSYTFQLPDGPAGAGSLEVTITADTFNSLLELNGSGTAEANNTATTTVTSTLAPYPDLQVINLTVDPPSLGGGTNVTIRWQDTNSGNAMTSGSWWDRVQVVNTNNGLTLLDATTPYNPGLLGPITNGTARDRSYNFTLPNNSNSAGGLVFTVTADQFNNVFEYNGAGTAENNNSASITRFSSLTPLPDLAVHDIIAPSTGVAGQTVQLVYVVTNRGTATATGPWSDHIYLSSDTTIGSDYSLGNFPVNATVPAGGFITLTQSVVVPVSGDAGDLHFVVTTDAGGAVLEQTDSNNSLLDLDNFNVPLALTLTLSANQIAENAVNPNISGTVTRNGNRSTALTVNLLSSDTTEIVVPASVVIGVGQVTANFNATAQQDGIYDGNQIATVTASAGGYPSVSTNITVTEGNIPFLTLSLSAIDVLEGSNFLATVTRDPVSASPLTVQLTSTDPTQLSAPATVQIPGNSASISFTVSAVEDSLVERTNNYTLTAAATGFISDSDTVRIRDNDIPDLTVTLASHAVSEGAGPNATSGTVTRSFPSVRNLVVALFSGNTTAALVPSQVIIPAGATSAVFTVSAVNDSIVDGPQTAAIGAAVLETGTSFILRYGAPDALTVTDDDGPTLTLTIAADLVGEGLNPATTATVTRNTSTNSSLLVNLLSGDTSEATVPPTVMIPAGAVSATFNIASVADGANDGNQTVTITASAPGFTSGSDTLVVSDADLPDIVIAALVSTNQALTDQTIGAELHLENRGLLGFTGSMIQRVFISSDALLGNDTLGAQVTYTGPFPVGDSIQQLVSLRMPSDPGNYWLIAQADATDNVLESLEGNNTFISPTPIVVEAAYLVTVSTTLTTALASTPVPIIGQATMRGSGTPAAFVPVKIHIEVRGIRRTFDVVTGADGRFSYTFQPLANEAGIYHLAAAHPGVVNPPTQDTFTLLGMSIAPVAVANLIEGSSISNSTRIDNLSDVPLTGLTAVVVTNAPNLTVTVALDTNTLGGFAAASLIYSIHAVDASYVQSPVVVRVSSAEGVEIDLVIFVRVEALHPRLTANPGTLRAAMQRGGQTTVAFTLANEGGVATGPLEVVAPNSTWLSVASPVQMPPLPPGSNTTVTLLLTPPSDLPLADYNGNLVIQSTNSALSVPFSFRAVSDATGNMLVIVEDEYTYFVAGAPRVANATVILHDALSGTAIATNTTGTNGSILFTNLTEAYYVVDVTAEDHSPFRETTLVAGGVTTNVTAFLPRETVRYTFSVVPTTVEDHYVLEIQSTFETQVPTPVVTISPASLDLSQYPGSDFQVQFTVGNSGLIAAENVRLDIPSSPTLEITPLISDIGRLAANTSLTVPVRIRRLSGGGGGAASLAASSAVLPQLPSPLGCGITAHMLWQYLCGPNQVLRNTSFYIFANCDINALYSQIYTRVNLPAPALNFPFGYGSVPISAAYQNFMNQLQPLLAPLRPPFWRYQCRPTPPPPPSLSGQSVTVTRTAQSLAAAPGEVCARVGIRLNTDAVLARDAFKATLEMENDTGDALENILVNLEVKDGSGALVNAIFGVRPPELSAISAVDGSGILAGHTTGHADWILVPTLDAAPTNGETLYLVGGTLSYLQAGTTVTVPLTPAPIHVFPQPELLVRYFHERDVFSDDPFTPQIEPSVPYSLAVQVNNVGYGAARSLRLSGGRPQIVDNEKGLLIEFKAIATQLENQSLTPALEVNFGGIDPGSNKVARWLFTSSIQGNFTNFSASFAHEDALGAQRLSLIRGVEIHELTHIVQADRSFEDGRPDMLVNDVQDADRFPETLYLSDGSIVPVTPVTDVTVNGSPVPGALSITVNATAAPGWTYLRFTDPGQGVYRLTQVRRADSSILSLGTNVWTTDRFFRGGELRPIRTNLVHLLDYNISGSYTLTYVPASLLADTNPPVSTVTALTSNSPPDFTVQWTGSDGTNGSGIAHFNVYASINGGVFLPWVTNTTLNSAIYSGIPGNRYSFYSRATDAAGNTEDAPVTPDAQTLVISVTNSTPTFTAIGQQTITENSTFNYIPVVTDSDVPTQTLTFTLLPGAPPGALFSRFNGQLTWTTTESDGGSSNAFRIVVTDNGSPNLSATQTVAVVVTEINSAPVMTGVPTTRVIFNEETSSAITLGANDSDLPPQTLSWQFVGVVPSGIAIDANTGLITWMPTETQGPGTNTVTVRVRDNGSPVLSDTRTITIVVNEVNRPPVLNPILNQTAAVLTPLTLTAIATDPDIPTNRLSFTLDPGAPSGARITRNGQFSWTPSRAQALSTNPITVRVTDNGLPALSDTKTFTVVVGNYFDVALGSTFVLAGQTGSVDITVTTTLPATNAAFTIALPVAGISNLALAAASPPLAAATLQQIGPTLYRANLQALNGQPLLGTRTVSSLRFVAGTNSPSAFVPLVVSNVVANQTNGAPISAIGSDGRVVYINRAPLLELGTNRVQLNLTIYAEPAPSYTLQSAPSLNPPRAWSNIWNGPVSNWLEVVLPGPTNAARFYRATRP